MIRRSWVRAHPPHQLTTFWTLASRTDVSAANRRFVATNPAGHVEQLPSGSWRVKVYAGQDPLTGREIRLRQTCKTEVAAQIELGKLLEQVVAGRQPESGATVAQLLDQYAQVAEWDLSTRAGFEGRSADPQGH
jgi:hypothetical protein